jgi:voltage-gated potassium channel
MIEDIRDLYRLLKKERFFTILAAMGLIVVYAALAIYFADSYYITKGAGGLLDAVYWAVVTVATVGYGDIVPISKIGKILTMLIILGGVGLLSLFTATIASIFVERKIREGQGLESIKEKDHVVICGWNENAEKVIESILTQTQGNPPTVVLVNELDRDDIQTIQYRFKDEGLLFVKGNFVKEDVLARANIVRARAAIVLADVSGGHLLEKADERTIFATMAIKSMASKVRTCAELLHPENREHLARANVDEIMIRGQHAGFLLASGAISPGVADSLMLLVDNEDENKLWRVETPPRFVGKQVVELSTHLRSRYGALVFAVIREKEGVKLEHILSHDSTFIDEFIRRKFEESGKDFFGSRKDLSVILNPPDDFVLGSQDWVVIISREKPVEAGIIDRLVGGGS